MGDGRCDTTKIGYPSKQAARRHAIAQQRRTGDRMAPYWCERCRRWHLTTPTPGDMHPPAGAPPYPRRTPPRTATVAELDAFLARHARGPRHDYDDEELEQP